MCVLHACTHVCEYVCPCRGQRTLWAFLCHSPLYLRQGLSVDVKLPILLQGFPVGASCSTYVTEEPQVRARKGDWGMSQPQMKLKSSRVLQSLQLVPIDCFL